MSAKDKINSTPSALFPDKFYSLGRKVSFKKGESVFRQGETHDFFYIITKGILKGIYNTEDGHEFIKTIIHENNFIGSLTAKESGGSCSFSLVCIENTEAVAIPFSRLDRAVKEDHEISIAVNQALEFLAQKKERREYELLCLSAEERYRLLVKNEPDLINRLTQNDIAKYLGITPVALSRIRSRIQKA